VTVSGLQGETIGNLRPVLWIVVLSVTLTVTAYLNTFSCVGQSLPPLIFGVLLLLIGPAGSGVSTRE
jgi:hypothetical protein